METEKNVISSEVAETEFVRFAKAARLKITQARTEQEQAAFDLLKRSFVEGIESGQIRIDDDGWPTVVLEGYDFITKVAWTRRPHGMDRCVLENFGDVSGQYAWIGSVTNTPAALLKRIDDRDWEVVGNVHQLFLVR